MQLPFRYRLSVTERCFWLVLALLFMLALESRAQSHYARWPGAGGHHRSRVLRPAPADTDDFVRNHGTGVRLGVELAAARNAVRGGRFPAVLEVGAYHQHRLGEVGSVQVEALYFHQPATLTEAAGRGLRLPLLLVLNPFDNVGFHVGPQLRWQPMGARTSEAGFRAAAPLTTEFVFGGEARVSRFRVGTRYALPLELVADLPAFGDRFGAAWRAGQLQVYLGANVFDR